MADENVIPFPSYAKNVSNGAREAMLEHILETGCTREDGEAWVDYTLADLWVRGFKVVPVDD